MSEFISSPFLPPEQGKISIIIPVYNVELYLDKCVRSVLSQTYKDIEVILVDDGSSDNSAFICDDFSSIDDRVIVIHKANGGLSDARNTGLKYATGYYLMFLDSDDYIEQDDDLKILIDEFKKEPDCDFIGFNVQLFYPRSNKFVQWCTFSDSTIGASDKNEVLIALCKQGVFPVSANEKIFKKDFLINNHLEFIKGIVSEDIPWFIEMMSCAKRCRFINRYAYVYRQSVAGSITSSFSQKKYADRLAIVQNESSRFRSMDFTPDGISALGSFVAYEYAMLFPGILRYPKAKRVEVIDQLESLSWLLDYKMNPKVKMVAMVYRLFGVILTARILRLYNWIRKRLF